MHRDYEARRTRAESKGLGEESAGPARRTRAEKSRNKTLAAWKEQRESGSENKQRARGSEKIARGRLGEKHGGSEKRTRIPEQRVQRSETESAEARRARAKQRNLGRAMACLHTCRARLG